MSGAPERSERASLVLAWTVLIGIELLTQLSLKFAGHLTGAFDFSHRAFS